MQISIYGDWLISIVLNKGQYASCLNPHVMLCKRHVCGYGFRLPAHWSIWNIELDRKKRTLARLRRKEGKISQANRYGIVGWTLSAFRYGSPLQPTLSVFVTKNGVVKVYTRLPFKNTKLREYKSEWLRASYLGATKD